LECVVFRGAKKFQPLNKVKSHNGINKILFFSFVNVKFPKNKDAANLQVVLWIVQDKPVSNVLFGEEIREGTFGNNQSYIPDHKASAQIQWKNGWSKTSISSQNTRLLVSIPNHC